MICSRKIYVRSVQDRAFLLKNLAVYSSVTCSFEVVKTFIGRKFDHFSGLRIFVTYVNKH